MAPHRLMYSQESLGSLPQQAAPSASYLPVLHKKNCRLPEAQLIKTTAS